MIRKLRTEDGFSLVELAFASAVSLAVLAALGMTLVSGFRTMLFGSNQSESLDKARLVLNQLQRDLQGSTGYAVCTVTGQPAGSCVHVKVQPPGGGERLVRYRLVGADLYREVDDGTNTFPSSTVLTDRLANSTNTPTTPLFVCNNVGSLLQVSIRMVVQPDPDDGPSYQLETVVRPRNTYQPPC